MIAVSRSLLPRTVLVTVLVIAGSLVGSAVVGAPGITAPTASNTGSTASGISGPADSTVGSTASDITGSAGSTVGLTASGAVGAAGPVEWSRLQAGVQINTAPDGRVVVTVPNATEGYDPGQPVTITVTAPGGQSESYTPEPGAQPNRNQTVYRVAPTALPNGTNLNGANVTVRANGTLLASNRLNLNYARITGASLGPQGGLVVQTARLAGFGNTSMSLVVGGNGQSLTVDAQRSGERSFRVPRGAISDLYLPPANVTITAAQTEGVRVNNGVGVDLRQTAEATTIETTEDAVVVTSRALLPGETYDVVVETDAGQFRDRVNTTSVGANGSLSISNEALAAESELTITVSLPGSGGQAELLSQTVTLNEGRTAGLVTAGNLSNGEPAVVNVSGLAANASVSSVQIVGANRTVVAQSVRIDGDRLTLAGIELRSGSRYGLLVRLSNEESVLATVGDGSYGVVRQAAPGGGGGQSWELPLWMIAAGVVLLAVGLVGGVVAFVIPGVLRDDGSPDGAGGSFDVTVRIEDSRGHSYDGEVELTARPGELNPSGGGPSPTDRISGGQGSLTLPGGGEWVIAADAGAVDGETQLNPTLEQSVTVRLSDFTGRLRFVDRADGTPVEGVDVTVQADGNSASERTNSDGIAEFTLSPTVSDLRVRTADDVYEDISRQLSGLRELNGEIRLAEETGSLAVRCTAAETPTAGLSVSVSERGGPDERTAETDGDGGAVMEDLLIGRYQVTATATNPSFGDATTTVEIEADREASATLDVPFEVSLSASQREQLDRLADATTELAPPAQIDGAIHHYYGTVFESLAGMIERLLAESHRFVGTETDAAALIDALLTVGVATLEATDSALNSKHNVDLFSACSQLPSARPAWEAGFDPARLFELADDKRGARDSALRSRIGETDDLVTEYRRELTVISPAREPFDELQSYYRGYADQSDEQNLAVGVLIDGYLRALEAMFEDQAIRDRLNTTVY